MIEKLLAELSKATVWMPAQVLKDKVGARNTTNVSLRLRDLEKNGSAVSRSRTEAGAKIVEWRHADKVNAGDLPPAGRATKAAPVVQDSLTTEIPTDKECCNAAKVVATTAGAEVAALNKQLAAKDEWIDAAKRKIADLENNGADQRAKLEESERLNIQWLGLAREHRVSSIDELRSRINSFVDAERQWEVAMMAAIGEDGTGSVTEAIAGLKETIKQQRAAIDAKDTELGINDLAITGWLELAKEFECKSIPELRVFINAAVDKLDRLRSVKAENTALTILNESMPGFGAMHKAISAGPFVVRTPRKPPRFTSKHANAHAVAMSAARRHGMAEVFALVPVGKAIRGAEWKDAA